MRTIFAILILVSYATAQSGGDKSNTSPAAGCTTPTGAHVTESWGDAATLCWTAGPSSCNHTWTIAAGASESIISTPAGAPANTACSNSLQMAIGASSNNYLRFTYTAISTSFDLTGTIYITTFPTSGSRIMVLCIANTTSCQTGNDLAEIAIDNNSVGSGTTIYGTSFNSGSNSTPQSVTTSTWYTFDLHWDTTAANCSLTINGGASHTFTCTVAADPTNLTVGTTQFGGVGTANTFVIGNLAW